MHMNRCHQPHQLLTELQQQSHRKVCTKVLILSEFYWQLSLNLSHKCDVGESTPKLLPRFSNSGHLCLGQPKILRFVQALNNNPPIWFLPEDSGMSEHTRGSILDSLPAQVWIMRSVWLCFIPTDCLRWCFKHLQRRETEFFCFFDAVAFFSLVDCVSAFRCPA